MKQSEIQRVSEIIAFRLTDGGKCKIHITDTAGKYSGWVNWFDLAALIREELKDCEVNK